MINPSDPRFQHCPRVDKAVRVCRREVDCRAEFGCTEPGCPLGASFGIEAFDQRLRNFATVLDLWPLSEAEQPDFP